LGSADLEAFLKDPEAIVLINVQLLESRSQKQDFKKSRLFFEIIASRESSHNETG
jgi:hypothetical protein